MTKYQVTLTAMTSVTVVVEVNPEDPYEDIDPYYAIDEALYDYDKYNLEEKLIKQLVSGESTVDFTVDSWEEMKEEKSNEVQRV